MSDELKALREEVAALRVENASLLAAVRKPLGRTPVRAGPLCVGSAWRLAFSEQSDNGQNTVIWPSRP